MMLCLHSLKDGQWEDLAKRRRRNKPRYTINKVAAAVNEVNGNYRQNQIELKARPMQDIAKEEADVYNGLIPRHYLTRLMLSQLRRLHSRASHQAAMAVFVC